jgi:hypothetical protein
VLTQIKTLSQHQNGAEIIHIGMRWSSENQIVQSLKVTIGIIARQMLV